MKIMSGLFSCDRVIPCLALVCCSPVIIPESGLYTLTFWEGEGNCEFDPGTEMPTDGVEAASIEVREDLSAFRVGISYVRSSPADDSYEGMCPGFKVTRCPLDGLSFTCTVGECSVSSSKPEYVIEYTWTMQGMWLDESTFEGSLSREESCRGADCEPGTSACTEQWPMAGEQTETY